MFWVRYLATAVSFCSHASTDQGIYIFFLFLSFMLYWCFYDTCVLTYYARFLSVLAYYAGFLIVFKVICWGVCKQRDRGLDLLALYVTSIYSHMATWHYNLRRFLHDTVFKSVLYFQDMKQHVYIFNKHTKIQHSLLFPHIWYSTTFLQQSIHKCSIIFRLWYSILQHNIFIGNRYSNVVNALCFAWK